eukprot:symbB.v1.2.029189.t1/scaffold3168.1/size62061/2
MGFDKDATKKTAGENNHAELQHLKLHENAWREDHLNDCNPPVQASSDDGSSSEGDLEDLANLFRSEALRALQPGAHVWIADLVQATHLNGSRAVLEKFDSDAGRWQVQLASGELVRVRPENLVPNMEAMSGASA